MKHTKEDFDLGVDHIGKIGIRWNQQTNYTMKMDCFPVQNMSVRSVS
jgi:hypothetical protein